MKITVTEKDIQDGLTGKRNICPVARAMRRDTGDRSIFVGMMSWTARSGRYSLPLPAIRFVAKYDAGEHVETFQFNLNYSGRKR